MGHYQRETVFLRQCMLYDDTAERQQLEERLAQVQRDERCLRRAAGLMVVLIALGMAGLGYAGIFLEDAQNGSRFMTPLVSKASCALALAALICLLAFLALGAKYRKDLDRCHQNCRRLALKLLESRLGKPGNSPLRASIKESSTAEPG